MEGSHLGCRAVLSTGDGADMLRLLTLLRPEHHATPLSQHPLSTVLLHRGPLTNRNMLTTAVHIPSVIYCCHHNILFVAVKPPDINQAIRRNDV